MKRTFALVAASVAAVTTGALFVGPSLAQLLGLGGMVLLAAIISWHRQLADALAPAREPAPRTKFPSLTVVRPVRGKDVGAADNFAAALDTGYPGDVETLFIFDDESDPGLPVARAAVAAHRAAGRRGRARVIVAGPPPAGRTGKLNAMVVGQRLARGELIAFGDSDTRPDRQVLRGVVEALLASDDNGAAFAPVLVNQPPRAAGDVLYALMQNALYAPLAAWTAGATRTLPFIMGQLMVFRRQALAAIGGVASVAGQLVDDMAIGQRVHAAGYRNVMSRHPLHIATGGMTLRQFLPLFRRWILFARNGLPMSFVWRQWLQGAEFFAALALALTAIVTSHALYALPAAAALVAQSVSLVILNRRHGGARIAWRWAWVAPSVFLLAPLVVLQNGLRKRVEWRGREYELDPHAALAPSLPAYRQASVAR
jgi:ceramide glucosyltransferase